MLWGQCRHRAHHALTRTGRKGACISQTSGDAETPKQVRPDGIGALPSPPGSPFL